MSRFPWDELAPGDRSLYCPGCGNWLEWGRNPRTTPLPWHGGPDGVCPTSGQTLAQIGAVLNGDGTTDPKESR